MITTVRQHLPGRRRTQLDVARRARHPLTLIIWTGILAGCSDDVTGPPEPVVASLEFAEAPATLLRSDTVRLTVVAKDSAGADINPSLVWAVDDGAVASVNNSGLVSGRAEGTTTIRVAAGALSDSISLTVTQGIRFALLTAGDGHTCGMDFSGSVYCWGVNWVSQLGVQATGNECPTGHESSPPIACSPRPVRVAGSIEFTTVSAGGSHTCGLDAEGRAHCWGANWFEQLGLQWDVTSESHTPVQVSGGRVFQALNLGGDFSCGLVQGGAAYCWGIHAFGELGIGNMDLFTSALPVAVVGDHQFVQQASGHIHACGLTGSGAAYCWGANWAGELGNGSVSPPGVDPSVPTPTAVVGGLTFSQVSTGWGFSCGLTVAGAAYCWGGSTLGQLGNGSTVTHASPQLVAGGLTWSRLSSSVGNSCGLTSAGEIACWGNNFSGQLGVADTGEECPTEAASGQPSTPVNCSTRPIHLDSRRKFKSVIAGGDHTCALDDLGYAFCWGQNQYASLGNGRVGGSSHVPSPVLRPE